MARIIRFHYPLSYRPASKPRPSQGARGKRLSFLLLLTGHRVLCSIASLSALSSNQVKNRTGSPENAGTLKAGPWNLLAPNPPRDHFPSDLR